MARLQFFYSAMNAGKSTALLQASYNFLERGMRTLLFAPAMDTRAGRGRIRSRIGLTASAIAFTEQHDLFRKIAGETIEGPVSCVFIDEAQFLTPQQVLQLTEVADQLNIPVQCYGLRTDFQGNLFPGSGSLLGWVDEIIEIQTICHCGRNATMVLRIAPDGKPIREGAQVEIGGNDRYVSVCRQHFKAGVGNP